MELYRKTDWKKNPDSEITGACTGIILGGGRAGAGAKRHRLGRRRGVWGALPPKGPTAGGPGGLPRKIFEF